LSTPMAAPTAGGTRGLSMYTPAAATAHMSPLALASMQPTHFDPVPVFIGPKPGWTGPVAEARAPDPAIEKAAVAAAAIPAPASANATAYAPGDKAAAAAEDAPPLTADTAPMALHAAVKPEVTKALIRKAGARPRLTRTADLNKTRTRGLVASPHHVQKEKKAKPAP
jgi:hypothetical protein